MKEGDFNSANAAKVSAAMRGDVAALQAVWHEHRRWIAAVILAHKPRTEDLDDLLQEVAMTMVAKINTLRDESNLRAWLRMIAVNAARAAARTERSRPALRLTDFDTTCSTMNTTWTHELDEQSQHIMQLVAQLPEAYREPLMLKAVQGMRTRQIAETLGISEATVDTRISRARRMLREQTIATDQPANHAVPVSHNGHLRNSRNSHE